MKKLVYSIFTIIILMMFAIIPLTGCSNGAGNGNLQMNTKYIHEADVNKKGNEQRYVLFRANGTGEQKVFFISDVAETYNEDYTIQFKYTYVNSDKSAVACLFDSVEYGDKHSDNQKVSTDWTAFYKVSKNILINDGSNRGVSYTIFLINENYLKSLPNFGK